MFSTHFPAWDPDYAQSNKFTDPYQAKLDKLAKEKAAAEPVSPTPAPAPASAAPVVPAATGYFSFDEVKSGKVPGMDLANKELYLDDATFKAKLGVDRAAFAAMPKWKRDAKKKEVGIF